MSTSKILLLIFSIHCLLLFCCNSKNTVSSNSSNLSTGLAEEAYYQKNFSFITNYDVTRYLFNLNQEILKNLSDLNLAKCPKKSIIKVIDKLQPLALTTPKGQILISSGLIQKLNNADELFFVLAHENAHVANCDLQLLTGQHDNLEQELAADLLAGKLLIATGRPISAGYSAINRLYEWQVGESLDLQHPSQVSRLKNLNQMPKNAGYQSPKAKQDYLNFQNQIASLSNLHNSSNFPQ